jgi:cbb3-type cytochrome oxidase subunit 3
MYMIAVIVVAATLFDLTKTREAMLHSLNQDHPTAVVILLALAVSAMVLDITGKIFCLSVPVRSGAFPQIVMSSITSVLGMAMNVISRLPNMGEYEIDLIGSSIVFTLVSFFCFLAFLRQLAAFLASIRLQIWTRFMQLSSMTLLGLALLAGMGGGISLISAIVVMMMALCGVALFGFYTVLIYRARQTTDHAAAILEEHEDNQN